MLAGKQKYGFNEQGGSAAKRSRQDRGESGNLEGSVVAACLFEPMPRVVTLSEVVLDGSERLGTEGDEETKEVVIFVDKGRSRKGRVNVNKTSDKEDSKSRRR